MTAIALDFHVPVAIAPRIDRAVGPEAAMLREQFRVMFDPQPSIALAHERLTTLHRLFDAVVENDVDSQGRSANSVQATTMGYALAFASAIPASLPSPDVWVDRDGEIAFDWDSGPRSHMSVRVGRDGTVTYAGIFGHAKSSGVETFSETIPSVVFENIKRATSSR